jgi:hypothetical protein
LFGVAVRVGVGLGTTMTTFEARTEPSFCFVPCA